MHIQNSIAPPTSHNYTWNLVTNMLLFLDLQMQLNRVENILFHLEIVVLLTYKT